MMDDDDEHERARAKAEADAKKLLEDAERLGNTANRLKALNAANDLDRRSAELAQSASRHEQREAAMRLEERSSGLAQAATRMKDASDADALRAAAEKLEERIVSLEESAKLSKQAMALRAELSADSPNSLNFRPMSFAEQMSAKAEAIQRDWQRALQGPVVVGGHTYSGKLAIVNTASYAELRGIKAHRYEPTDDADAFEINILDMYHGSIMCDEETLGAKRIARYINGGPLLHYISRCPGLSEMKEKLTKANEFWKKHSKYQYKQHENAFTLNSSLSNNGSSSPFFAAKPYRAALVESGTLSTSSASDAAAIKHHRKVRRFLAEISVADAREHLSSHARRDDLSCIYEMHRDDTEDDAVTTRTKVGKAHATNYTIANYFYNKTRRDPFTLDGEDEAPPPDSLNGNILFFIDGPGTLFDRRSGKALSNYLVEFVEGLVTAAMFPTLRICPSISMLGDGSFGVNDPKFFDTCRFLVNKIIDGKFTLVSRAEKRDAAYSKEEWAEAMKLTDWYYTNIKKPRKDGSLSVHREEFLENIGFFRIFHMNTKHNAAWMKNFRDLKNHITVEGFRKWPTEKMRKWTIDKRRELRTGGDQVKTDALRAKNQWKIDLLESIGFPWIV